MRKVLTFWIMLTAAVAGADSTVVPGNQDQQQIYNRSFGHDDDNPTLEGLIAFNFIAADLQRVSNSHMWGVQEVLNRVFVTDGSREGLAIFCVDCAGAGGQLPASTVEGALLVADGSGQWEEDPASRCISGNCEFDGGKIEIGTSSLAATIEGMRTVTGSDVAGITLVSNLLVGAGAQYGVRVNLGENFGSLDYPLSVWDSFLTTPVKLFHVSGQGDGAFLGDTSAVNGIYSGMVDATYFNATTGIYTSPVKSIFQTSVATSKLDSAMSFDFTNDISDTHRAWNIRDNTGTSATVLAQGWGNGSMAIGGGLVVGDAATIAGRGYLLLNDGAGNSVTMNPYNTSTLIIGGSVDISGGDRITYNNSGGSTTGWLFGDAAMSWTVDDDIADNTETFGLYDDGDSTPNRLFSVDGAGDAAATGSVTTGTFLIPTAQTFTIADSGDDNPATSSSTPAGTYVAATCSDAHSCEWTLGETGVTNGAMLTITNVGSNRLVLMHSAGVAELYKASRQTLMGGASVTLEYDDDRWTQTGVVIDVVDGTKTLTTGDSPYALLYTDRVLICDTSGGNIEIDLTAAASWDQTRVVSVLKTSASNTLTIDPNSSENLNGTSTSTSITTVLDGMSIVSDGADLWGF